LIISFSKILFSIGAAFLFLFVETTNVSGQTDSTKYEKFNEIIIADSIHVYKLILNDGSEIKCRVTSLDSSEISFLALSGLNSKVKIKFVNSIETVRGKWKNSEFVQYQPHSTHLIIAPTAYTLPQGSFYFSYANFFIPTLTYSPVDFADFSAGMFLLPLNKFDNYYFYGKLLFYKMEGFSASVGGLIYKLGNEKISAPFIVITMDNGFFLLNIGASGKAFNNSNIIMAGAEIRSGKKHSIILEGWAMPNSKFNYFGIAFRYRGYTFGSDIGFFKPLNQNFFNSKLMPIISFNYFF